MKRLNEWAVYVCEGREAISSNDRRDPRAVHRHNTQAQAAPHAFSFSGGEALWCRGGVGVHPERIGCSRPGGALPAHERRATAARPIFQSAEQLNRLAQPVERIAFAIADPAPLAKRGHALR